MMGGPQYLLLAVGTFLLASKCLDADFSTISSPGYPRTYPPKGETIRHGVKSGSRMKLTIKKMSLSDGDTVTIYNGYYCSTWRVGHFVLKTYTASNANVDDVLFSNGNKVCVELKAPKGGGSFYIEVEDANSYYKMQSPGYPGTYPPTKSWLKRPNTFDGGRMKLSILKMDLAEGDTVTIYNGYYCSSWRMGSFVLAKFTGPVLSEKKVLFSTGQHACIEFNGPNGYGGGFDIMIEGIPVCHGSYRYYTGDILSPSFPHMNYKHNQDCRWSVSADRGQRIEFKFIEFDLDAKDPCDAYLQMYDVNGINGKLCKADVKGKTFVSTGRESDVVFHSPESFLRGRSGHKGFWIVHTALGCKAKGLPRNSEKRGHLANAADYYYDGYMVRFTCPKGYTYPGEEAENKYICRERNWWGHQKECVALRAATTEATTPGAPPENSSWILGPVPTLNSSHYNSAQEKRGSDSNRTNSHSKRKRYNN